MRPMPMWLQLSLQAIVLLAATWVVLFPTLDPLHFLPRDPDSGAFLDLIRSHRTTVPFHTAWSSEGLRWLGLPTRFTLAALAGLLIALSYRWKSWTPSTISMQRRTFWGLGLMFTTLGVAGFWSGRVVVPVMLTYGDTPALIGQIHTANWVFPAEPLTMHLFNGLSRLLTTWRGSPDGLLAGQVTALLCGSIFLWATWILVRSRTSHLLPGLMLLAALTLTGTLTQFFGYIETTVLQVAAIASYLAAAAWTLMLPEGRARNRALFATHGCLGIVVCSHAAGVALLPSLLALWWALTWQAGHRPAPLLRSLLSRRNLFGAALGVALPWLLIVWLPFYRQGHFGNSTGGADAFRFVPWDVASARQTSQYVYYSMLSRLHLLDFTAAMLAAAPLAVPQIISAGVLRRRAGNQWNTQHDGLHLVLASAALACTSVVLLWDFDFGMWGDWNIATCYLVPLQVYAWVVFFDAIRQLPQRRRLWLGVFAPMIVVQAALALGMWMQFHPPGVH